MASPPSPADGDPDADLEARECDETEGPGLLAARKDAAAAEETGGLADCARLPRPLLLPLPRRPEARLYQRGRVGCC